MSGPEIKTSAPAPFPPGLHNAFLFAAFNALSFPLVVGNPMILYAKTLGASATAANVVKLDQFVVATTREMDGAAIEARRGITVNNFPRGTIVSVGLHPLRNGQPAGGRGKNGFFKCPADTPPAPGKHCDSVQGSMEYGEGVLPTQSDPLPPPQ